jgi:hypothetical protein
LNGWINHFAQSIARIASNVEAIEVVALACRWGHDPRTDTGICRRRLCEAGYAGLNVRDIASDQRQLLIGYLHLRRSSWCWRWLDEANRQLLERQERACNTAGQRWRQVAAGLRLLRDLRSGFVAC